MSQNKQITEDYELQEWLEALDNVINKSGSDRASEILSQLASKLTSSGTIPTFNLTTPFRNTIPITDEARMPGDLFLERKIRSYIRWNALAMVLKANKSEDDLGGISQHFHQPQLYMMLVLTIFLRAIIVAKQI